MCVVSNIGSGWQDSFPHRWPNIYPTDKIEIPLSDFEALRAEMRELKNLLIAAKKFDESTGQPECEEAEKVRLIKDIAKAVGVDMAGVFKGHPE